MKIAIVLTVYGVIIPDATVEYAEQKRPDRQRDVVSHRLAQVGVEHE